MGRSHRPFSLVLASGGARGYAHAGVLRALVAEGYRPSAIVGVSMGAIIAATYALRDDWYECLLDVDTSQFPNRLPTREEWEGSPWQRVHAVGTYARLAYESTLGWDPAQNAFSYATHTLTGLTQGRDLEDARIPVAVCATDLQSGARRVLTRGPAAKAAYASAALPGLFPPARIGGDLLIDGAYADIAPIDVARDFAPPLVIAIDPTQPLAPKRIKNGFQAMLRAVEICQMRHADLRFENADLVLRPPFRRTIDTLEFDARRECIAAGFQAVRQVRDTLRQMLDKRSPAGLAGVSSSDASADP